MFDFEGKRARLAEVARELEASDVWSDPKRAQELGREKKQLETTVRVLAGLDGQLRDARELFQLARSENDDATLAAIETDVAQAGKTVADLEFRRMFSDPLDPNNCFMDIQSGS
ncbi:MAG TPA: PCRF domain-containing protein, partial [Polyangiaceae bacterium]